MSWIPDRYRGLRSLLGRSSLEDEVDEELGLHLAMRAADLEAAGLSAAAAREEARRRFGNMNEFRSQLFAIEKSIRRERRRMEIMETARREMRQAVRSLVRAPVFASVAIVTLALGIGAATAIFTLLDAIVLRPLPYPEQDRLVQINHAVPLVQDGLEWGNSVASYFYYSDANSSFEELGAVARTSFGLSGDGEAERVDGARATASLLRVLGARTVQGRLIGEADDEPGVDLVALISHELWQNRYAADPAIIGRTIQLNASPVRVIGVLEAGFSLPNHATRIWVPLQLDRTEPPINAHAGFVTYGMLRPGVTPDAARADLHRLTQNLPELFPNAYGGNWIQQSGFSVRVHPLRSMVLGSAGGRVGIDRVLWMLLGAVMLVLLIACANVANLLLVRGEARRRELSVRSALGAERAHMAMHFLSESMLLTGAAAVLGIGLAWAGIQLLIASAPTTLPRLGDVALGTNGVLFALGISLGTGLLFGLAPVTRARSDYSELRESGRGMTASRERHFVRNALVVGQVGMALVLLACGALMLTSFNNLRRVQSGIDGENVLTFTMSLPFARYQEEEPIFRFQQEFVQRVRSLAGVETVSATTSLPLAGSGLCAHTVGEATTGGGCVPTVMVLPGYFDALGIRVTGETFDWADLERRTDGAVISRALADRMWPGQDPIGRNIISYQDGPPWFRIIGVADDVLADGLDQPPVQAVYYPTRRPDRDGYWGPHGHHTMHFIVRAGVSTPESLTGAIRTIVRDLDPEVPVANVRTMHAVIMGSERMARTTFTMMMLGVAAVVALFLSAVGLYGVIAYLVGRRRTEIGVRMALGARVSEVARLVVLQSVGLTALGVVIGIGAALFMTRALSSLVWGVEPTDPLTLVGVSVLLLAVAVMASLVPARRAARIDPAEALRSD